MNKQKMSNLKPIVSVTEIAKMTQLSRARFYQLLEIGFFPKPLYDERSKRPYYDIALQQKILESRWSGIGADGSSFMLFYSTRKKETAPRKKIQKVNPIYTEFTETLNSMGLNCSAKDVAGAMSKLYPDGIKNIDQGVVIRDIFRFLGSK